jgi:threonine dehydrogenase-like Zn-dependent dehydrogenase
VDLLARHDHQRAAGARLGAGEPSGVYDVVIDAAGTASALEKAVEMSAPRARLICVATYWEGMTLPGFLLCLKEVTVYPASLYGREGPSRDVDVAATLLAENPEIARAIVTHRFPLDAAVEAFRVAADRRAGAIKVVLEP